MSSFGTGLHRASKGFEGEYRRVIATYDNRTNTLAKDWTYIQKRTLNPLALVRNTLARQEGLVQTRKAFNAIYSEAI